MLSIYIDIYIFNISHIYTFVMHKIPGYNVAGLKMDESQRVFDYLAFIKRYKYSIYVYIPHVIHACSSLSALHSFSEKADLKSRSDSSSNGPHMDSIYTTPAGFHHHQQHMQPTTLSRSGSSTLLSGLVAHPHPQSGQNAAAALGTIDGTTGRGGQHSQQHQQQQQHHQQQHHQQGSPEAMKVRMAAMVLQPPTRV